MPWSKDNLPDAAKNLSDSQKATFVKVANRALKGGKDEGSAIAIGLSVAQGDSKKEGR